MLLKYTDNMCKLLNNTLVETTIDSISSAKKKKWKKSMEESHNIQIQTELMLTMRCQNMDIEYNSVTYQVEVVCIL